MSGTSYPNSTGVFWESPDIFVAPDQSADSAPLLPPTTGGVAKAGVPNTLYAHVWNLGKAPAYRVRVEFYWFNPTLGISRADAHLVGAAWVDLANRFTLYPGWQQTSGPDGQTYMSRGCHAIVRCPITWIPIFVNGGHECLVVRDYEPMLDCISFTQFSPAADRHVAQRNIAVVQAASPAAINLTLDLGYYPQPSEADLDVELVAAGDVEWLKLYRGDRHATFQPPPAAVVVGITPPVAAGTRPAQGGTLPTQVRFSRGCEPLVVGFHASLADLQPDQAQVLRVRQQIDGQTVGGYSVVLIGR